MLVKEAAELFQVTESSIHKQLTRLKLERNTVKLDGKIKTELDDEAVEVLKQHYSKCCGLNYEEEIDAELDIDTDVDAVIDETKGVFYLMQPDPEYRPARIKLGYATNAKVRALEFFTANPEITIVKTWPCRKRSWEKTIIDLVQAEHANVIVKGDKVSQEVFDLTSPLENVSITIDKYFNLLSRAK
jgi:hypothetical protein